MVPAVFLLIPGTTKAVELLHKNEYNKQINKNGGV